MREDATFTALQWQEAIETGGVDWTLFTEWLEADPAHRDAYGAVSRLIAMIDSHGIAPGPALPAEAVARNGRMGESPAVHEPRRPVAGTSRYSAAKPI